MANLSTAYNPLDAGIDNTGASDVNSALQTWLQGLPEHSMVLIPNGTYRLNGTVRVNKALIILCESSGGVLFDANLGSSTAPVWQWRSNTWDAVDTADAAGCIQYPYWFGGRIDRDLANGPGMDWQQIRHGECVKASVIRCSAGIQVGAVVNTNTGARKYTAGFTVMYCVGTLLTTYGLKWGQDPDYATYPNSGSNETNRNCSLHNFWEGTSQANSYGEWWMNGHGNVAIGGLRRQFDYGFYRKSGSGAGIGVAPWVESSVTRAMGGNGQGVVLGKATAWNNPDASSWRAWGPTNPGI